MTAGPERRGIARRIVGYHTDELGDWVAELECGHGQHVRHDPPWQVRAWVTSERGRAAHLGTTLWCVRCVEEGGASQEEPVRHEIRDPDFATRVRASFDRQRFMATLGATLERVAPGEIAIAFTHREALTQQHGFLHAGVLTSIADSACGYAALSLMEPGVGVLSVEFKVNMLAPAVGERFVATGRVVRSGRTLTVCAGEVTTEQGGNTVAVLLMQATMMAVRGKAGVAD